MLITRTWAWVRQVRYLSEACFCRSVPSEVSHQNFERGVPAHYSDVPLGGGGSDVSHIFSSFVQAHIHDVSHFVVISTGSVLFRQRNKVRGTQVHKMNLGRMEQRLFLPGKHFSECITLNYFSLKSANFFSFECKFANSKF